MMTGVEVPLSEPLPLAVVGSAFDDGARDSDMVCGSVERESGSIDLYRTVTVISPGRVGRWNIRYEVVLVVGKKPEIS